MLPPLNKQASAWLSNSLHYRCEQAKEAERSARRAAYRGDMKHAANALADVHAQGVRAGRANMTSEKLAELGYTVQRAFLIAEHEDYILPWEDLPLMQRDVFVRVVYTLRSGLSDGGACSPGRMFFAVVQKVLEGDRV